MSSDQNIDHVYMNISVHNSTDKSVPLRFSESRTSPIINDPSLWCMSIIRFTCPGAGIPISIMKAKPYPNTDVNILDYAVSITQGGSSSDPVNLIWTGPQYDTVSTPIVPLFTALVPNQNGGDPYYFLESYQQFVDMVNVALATAYSLLAPTGTTKAPYITYDSVTTLFSMWAETAYSVNVDPSNAANGQIWFNTRLYEFFPSFLYVFNGYTPIHEGENYAIIIRDTRNNSGGTGMYKMTQEYSSVYAFNSLQTISFRSNSIPVVPEATTGLGLSGEIIQGGSTNNTVSIITDFEPGEVRVGGSYKESIQYIPYGEYRISDLIGNSPLTFIDMFGFWGDKRGYTHVMMIQPHDTYSSKILFIKKSALNKFDQYSRR